jgi:hypothetical protein
MKVFVRADRVSIPHISVITRKIATCLGRLFQNSPISLALRAHRLIPIPVRIAEFGKLNGLFLSKTPDGIKFLIALDPIRPNSRFPRASACRNFDL